MALGGLRLRYATAQPLAKLGTAQAPVYAFFAQPATQADFVVEDTPGLKVDRAAGVERKDGAVWVRGMSPGPDSRVTFTLADGKTVTIVLLRQMDAEVSWRIASGGATDLLMTTDQAFVDGDVATLESMGSASFSARLLGTDAKLVAADAGVTLKPEGAGVSVILPEAGAGALPVETKLVKEAGEVAPLPVGFAPSSRPRMVAAAPLEEDWARAGVWTLKLPKAAPSAKVFLRIGYEGDVARLMSGEKLLTDNFNDGRAWLVGLDRFLPELKDGALKLAIYPLRKDAPIFFEPKLEPDVPGPQSVRLDSVEMVEQYRVRMKMVTAK
jgi:hypothetical protein